LIILLIILLALALGWW